MINCHVSSTFSQDLAVFEEMADQVTITHEGTRTDDLPLWTARSLDLPQSVMWTEQL